MADLSQALRRIHLQLSSFPRHEEERKEPCASMLWSTLALTMIMISITAVTLILVGVGSAVSIHLLKLKILTAEILVKVREGLKNPEIIDEYPAQMTEATPESRFFSI